MTLNLNQKILSVLLGKIQEIEDAFWSILDGYILATATGAQLDTLGRIVGAKRDARSDTDFRAAIRIQIRVNRSKGRAEDVIDVARLASVNSTPRYWESYPAAWELYLANLPGGLQIAKLLGKAKAAATYGVLNYTDTADPGFVWLNDGDTPATEEQWSDDNVTTNYYPIDLGAGGT